MKAKGWQLGKDLLKTKVWVAMLVGCHGTDAVGSRGLYIGLAARGDLSEAVMMSVWTHIRVALMINRRERIE